MAAEKWRFCVDGRNTGQKHWEDSFWRIARLPLFNLFIVVNCVNQSMELIKLLICHFRNEEGTGAEMPVRHRSVFPSNSPRSLCRSWLAPISFSFLKWRTFTFISQASVVLQQIKWQKDYPMDFYANTSLGSWTVNNEVNRQATVSRRRKHLQTEKLTSEEKEANVESKDDCGGERGDCCGKCHQENSQKLNKTEKIYQ